MLAKTALALGAVLVPTFAIACGASPSSPNGSPPADSTNPPPPASSSGDDGGAPEAATQDSAPPAAYPAFKPDMAQLVKGAGDVLAAPVIVTVTWPGDPDVATYEGLGDSIGETEYWKAIVGEYGVGPATSGVTNHVHMAQPLPASVMDPSQFVVNGINGTTQPKWPAPTPNTIYVMYFTGAAATALCNMGAGGYHDNVMVNGMQVPYAVSAACTGMGDPLTAAEEATISASHEMAEGSVDPRPSTTLAWAGVSDAQLAWDLMQQFQDENGDLCEFYDDSYVNRVEAKLPYYVQRTWSNKSAAAGHNPCVPAARDPYFNVTTLSTLDMVKADLSSLVSMGYPGNPAPVGKGAAIAIGKSSTVQLGLYSDAPTDAWQISAFEMDPLDMNAGPLQPATNPTLTVSLDKPSGKNGDTATLTIQRNKDTTIKVALVVVLSQSGKTKHYYPVLVGSP